MAEQEIRLVVGRQDEVADQVAQLAATPAPEAPVAAPAVAGDPAPPPAPAAAPPPAPAVTAAVRVLDDGRIVDGAGRKLKLRELSMLQELDLMALAGDSRVMNRAWWTYISNAARVDMIDDITVPFPTSDQEMRVMAARVGREGIAAVIGHLFPAAGDSTTDQGDEAKSKN